MRFKISDVYLIVNKEHIPVGVVVSPEDQPTSCCGSETITVSEYQRGLKDFTYGSAHINDCVFHCVGEFENFKATRHVNQIWLDELKLMGYNVDKLENVPEEL